MLKRLWPYFLLAGLGSLLVTSLLKPGLYASHDGIFHVYRTEEAWNMLKLGEFPLRWAGNFDQGFGIPLFTFVYPLPYYLTGLLSPLIGSIWAVKSLIIVAYLAGGLGIYRLFAQHGRWWALSLALIYLMTPYQFLNVFVRGTLGEILALGLIPWVLVSFDSLWSNRKPSLCYYHPIPLGLLLIAHNFLGILFTVFLAGYLLLDRRSRRQAASSLLISLGLAAFFLLPMIGEKSLLYSFDHDFLTFLYDQHFVSLKQLLYGKWDYWYSVPGDNDGLSFQLGLAQIVVAGVGVGSILLNRKRSWAQIYLIVAYFGSLFLMTARSYYIWDKIKILQTVQFPWRLLFMPAILTPLLGLQFLLLFRNRRLANLVLAGVLALGFWNIRNYRRPIRYLDMTEFTDLYRLYYNKTSTTFRTEILPKLSVPNERYKSDEILVNSGNMTIDNLSYDPLSLEVTLHNKPDSAEGRVTILRNFYPGWKLTLDGQQSVELVPTPEGMLSFIPELGIHSYRLRMQNTPLERAANALSLFSITSLGYLWWSHRRTRKT